jgi:hypothetical protein
MLSGLSRRASEEYPGAFATKELANVVEAMSDRFALESRCLFPGPRTAPFFVVIGTRNHSFQRKVADALGSVR